MKGAREPSKNEEPGAGGKGKRGRFQPKKLKIPLLEVREQRNLLTPLPPLLGCASAFLLNFQKAFRGFWGLQTGEPCARAASAWVAQLVEHVLGKDEVAGSIPVPGSTCCSDRFN